MSEQMFTTARFSLSTIRFLCLTVHFALCTLHFALLKGMLIKTKIFCVVCSLVLASAAIFVFFGRAPSLAEQSLPIVVTNIQPTTATKTPNLPSNSMIKEPAIDAKFVSAAARNSQLKLNLIWAFGGKAQRGWFIYAKLISELIGTDASVDSSEFAESLARWQTTAGVPPNGVLDETTLAVIVTYWQANRLKARGYASPGDLLTAPPPDFYSPERPFELRQLERNTYTAYKKMVAAALKDKSLNLATDERGNLAGTEKFFKIISAFRSREYQEKLRRESPNSGRAGLATNSPHFTGRALDIYVGGEAVDTKDANRAFQVQTPAYRWLVKNAGKFGFKPYFYEPWHWEFVGSEK